MHYTYRTQGTCSQVIDFEIGGGVVTDVRFQGGCNGNLKAVARLVEGCTAEEIAEKLGGITCGPRRTSCGDQLARAVLQASEAERSAADLTAAQRKGETV